ncbi:PA2169 family four-helix-bundle protein [Aestuariibacter sp. AA17]|uniref:PA2169 family four-helix-bundle protein n=1 Tax=Fluctibacter corallii TaxID=2984329 RepID=A0ABT3A4T2_9ALTE|nr:PA2169 family four-helix-bundle protein [Aestuariibacter sp. AA17]MCV2883692.1 PA2169 family four-helix-bundle protein [Aestuariibacter sp. AA17]
MSNQVRQVEKVSDIIKVLRAGAEFYEDAKDEVKENRIEVFFDRMADQKRQAAESLQSFSIAEQGEMETGEAVSVNMRKLYTDIVSLISTNKTHTVISQLEEVEDKILEVIDEALEEDQPDTCARALRKLRAQMQENHDEMKALQKATH